MHAVRYKIPSTSIVYNNERNLTKYCGYTGMTAYSGCYHSYTVVVNSDTRHSNNYDTVVSRVRQWVLKCNSAHISAFPGYILHTWVLTQEWVLARNTVVILCLSLRSSQGLLVLQFFDEFGTRCWISLNKSVVLPWTEAYFIALSCVASLVQVVSQSLSCPMVVPL